MPYTKTTNIESRLLPIGTTGQEILDALKKAKQPGPQGATGPAGNTGPSGPAGQDVSTETATSVESQDEDFDRLLVWLVDKFSEIPPGLEDRYARAIERM